MHARTNVLGATLLAAGMLLACGSSNPSQQQAYPAQPPPAQPGPGTAVAPGSGTPTPAPATPAPATAGPTTSTPTASTAPAAGSAQELDRSMAAPLLPLLQQLLKTQGPAGAKPMGNPIVASFSAPGQRLQKQLQLTGNKCYTVVAAGAPGVAEVNLAFVPVLPLAQPIAEDKTTGPQAVLGPSPQCYTQIAFSAPMNLVIEVPQGQGLVAVQVYEK